MAATSPQISRHIFISYSLHDTQYVNRLEAELQANGYDVWRDRSDLNVGDTWVAKIEEALNAAWAVVVVQSHTAKESRWVFNEVEYAQNKNIPVIPILLEGEPWFGFLHKQFIDMRGKEDQALPDEFYADLLRYAPPYPIHKDIEVDKLVSNTGDRVSLIPKLEEIARNPRSSRGHAAEQLLASLSQDSDQYVRVAALEARQKLIQQGILKPTQQGDIPKAPVRNKRLWIIGSLAALVLVIVIALIAILASGDEKQSADAPLLLVDIIGGDLRSGPGYDYLSILTLRDVEVPIIGISVDGDWYQVEYEGNVGWVSAVLFRTRGKLTSLPVIEVAPPTPATASSGVLVDEDFEDGEFQGLGSVNGTWEIEADDTGNLVYSSNAMEVPDYSNFSFGSQAWTNYSLEFRFRIIDSSAPDVAIAVFLRNTGTGSAYSVGIERGGSRLTFNHERADTSWETIEVSSFQWGLKVWYSIKIVADGSHFTFFVDGEQVLEADNDLFSHGNLTFGIPPLVHIQVDDLKVTALDD